MWKVPLLTDTASSKPEISTVSAVANSSLSTIRSNQREPSPRVKENSSSKAVSFWLISLITDASSASIPALRGVGAIYLRMQCFSDRHNELHGYGLRITPRADRSADIRVIAEIDEQTDHSTDIVRVVSPLQETLTRRRNIRIARQQLPSSLGVADGNPHELLEELVVSVGVRNAVPIQMEYRIFLRFGPETFTADISPQRRKRVQREQQNRTTQPQ